MLYRMRVNGLKLHWGRFRLGIGKNASLKTVFKPWHRGLGAVVESLSLGVFKRHMHDTLGYSLGLNISGAELMDGLEDLRGIFPTSMIVCYTNSAGVSCSDFRHS